MSQIVLFSCFVLLFGIDAVYSASLNECLDDICANDNAIDTFSYDEDYDMENDDLEFLTARKFSLSFPGTKWCGPDNTAKNFDDISTDYPETDSCCREHDNCNGVISAREEKYGLENPSFYSRLSCECDLKFHECLSNSNDELNNFMGNIYFNLLGTKCYKKDHPISKCVQKKGVFLKKCLMYETDKSKPMIYQWFDVPSFP